MPKVTPRLWLHVQSCIHPWQPLLALLQNIGHSHTATATCRNRLQDCAAHSLKGLDDSNRAAPDRADVGEDGVCSMLGLIVDDHLRLGSSLAKGKRDAAKCGLCPRDSAWHILPMPVCVSFSTGTSCELHRVTGSLWRDDPLATDARQIAVREHFAWPLLSCHEARECSRADRKCGKSANRLDSLLPHACGHLRL